MKLPNLSDAVSTQARLRPHQVAVQDSITALTYAELDLRGTKVANALLELGLREGDRVGVLAKNAAAWLELYVALARAGLVVVPINFRLSHQEVGYILKDSGAKALLAQHTFIPLAEQAVDEKAGMHKIVLDGDKSPGWLPYTGLIDAGKAARGGRPAPRHDVAALMYTSGTTGSPKGVIRSHQGSTLMAMATAVEMGFTQRDRALIVMPLCHANSLYFSHTFLHLGATCVIDDSKSFDPQHLLRLLSSHEITFTSLVPTHFVMLLSLPEAIAKTHDVSAVSKLMVSSAPIRKETKRQILEFFPNGQLHELYGSTEAGWVTLLRPSEQIEHIGSIGREWAFSGPIKVLDDAKQEVPDGVVGEIFSNTAYAFDGYWRLPDKTDEAMHGAWCSVGDMGYRDPQGYLHLVDRKSNMIISGGENIYPSEVEGVLCAHESVQDAAVVGVPDDKWGEAVYAFVAFKGNRSMAANELSDWCATQLARFKVPRYFAFIAADQIPRNATGKVLHRELRKRAQQHLAEGKVN